MTVLPCRGTVVVVDDEEDTRELLRELLESRGHEVTTAKDGVEALDIVRHASSICIMILDLMMPRMDGAKVVETLQQEGRSFPVWISTSAPERAPKGMPCLPKPVDVDRLLSIVDEHCIPSR